MDEARVAPRDGAGVSPVPLPEVRAAPALEERAPQPVACLVVAYHRSQRLRELLHQLRAPDLEIVVVNVDDDPEVAAIARPHRIVDISGNPGYAAAVNAGAAACRSSIVVFMNDDVSCAAADVRTLAQTIAAGAGVALPRIVDGEGRPQRTIAALPGVGALLREWVALPDTPVPGLAGRMRVEKWRLPDRVERVEAAAATVVAVRRDLLLAHPLPEDYFLYWEESEWFFRLARIGVLVQYQPGAVFEHLGGRDDVRPDKARLLARNAVRCVRRTRGRIAAMFAYPVVSAWWIRLLIVDTVRAVLGRGEWRVVAARQAGLLSALGAWREVSP
jgi:N-acetylglucosaminyl-diphospho-decaprenol L-rhamnosyltransferase